MTPLAVASLALVIAVLGWSLYNFSVLLVGLLRGRRRRASEAGPDEDRLPSVSLLIPAKNEERTLPRLLEALLSVEYPRERLEVVVVEDGSKDGTVRVCEEFMERHPGFISLVRKASSEGKPSSLNYALQRVAGDIVGVFDADSVPEPDVLLRVGRHFADSRVVAVQGVTRSINSAWNMLTRLLSREEEAWFRVFLRGKDDLGLFVPLTGSCQFIRREVLEEVGGWDSGSLAEDCEMAARFLSLGYTVRYAEDVRSWHESPSRLRALVGQRTRWFRGYMETFLRYGRLLRRPSWRNLDAEVTLMGPYLMVASSWLYVVWLLSALGLVELGVLPAWFTGVFQVLTAFALFVIGVALYLSVGSGGLRSLVWIPFIYLYWALLTVIATRAFLQMVLRRPSRWVRTEKDGVATRSLSSMRP